MINAIKAVSEELILDFDFLNRCAIGETVETYDATVAVISGIDPTPASILNGVASVITPSVYLPIARGLPGVVYSVVVAARTNRNNVYVLQAALAVKTDTETP